MTRMRRWILGVGLLLGGWIGYAATPLYENRGTVTSAPQIDATAFANYGIFEFDGVLPYETQNTRYYTNFGAILGTPGFRFENIDQNGVRKPADNFINGVDASVFATSGTRFILGVSLGGAGAFSTESAQVIVVASNIVNRGQLHADANGRVKLSGDRLDLERSSVGIQPFTGGFGFLTPTNFVPEVGIFDAYWGINAEGTVTMNPGGVVRPVRGSANVAAEAPRHSVTNEFFVNGINTGLLLTNAAAFVLTNAVTPTNWLVQAVFVQNTRPEIAVDVRFADSTIPTNEYKTAIVEFSRLETNVLIGENFLNQIYLIDRMAAETNYNLLTNLVSTTTYMPANYEVTRLTPFEFVTAGGPNVTTNVHLHVHNGSFTNQQIVTNIYAGYAFDVTNVTATLPSVPGVSITNLPGRVEIEANDLNLNRTRIRGEGIVSIKADNVSGNSNLVIDVPNLGFNLRSQSGKLTIRNLSKDRVERTTGRILAWSGMWTNQTGFLSTNTIPNPNDPTTTTNEVATNVVDVGFHVLIVDARLQPDIPVFVANFKSESASVELADTLRLVEDFEMNTESLKVTETGQILLSDTINNWSGAEFPSLKRLENAGYIQIPNSGFFTGRDGSALELFDNKGTVEGFNLSINAKEVSNSGILFAAEAFFAGGGGMIRIKGDSVKLEGGGMLAGNEIDVEAKDLKLLAAAIETGQSFTLTVSDTWSDGGLDAPSTIKSEGFSLRKKPALGNLLGTTFESTAPKFLAISHISGGEDRGANAAGFENNVAIGRLVLDGGFDSLLSFSGASGGNALYVDRLEISDNLAGDVAKFLSIDKSLVLYFADSNVPVDQLNGLFADASAPEGRLRWVSEFAGPNSSVEVPLRGGEETTLMNRSLRESLQIDSDNDGIPNGADEFPLDSDSQQVVNGLRAAFDAAGGTITFSWAAKAGSKHVIEFTSSLSSGKWEVLSQHENTTQQTQSAVAKDRIEDGAGQRFYRLRVK